MLLGSAAVHVEKLGREKPISRVRIPLYGLHEFGYDASTLAAALSSLFMLVLSRSIEVIFVARPMQLSFFREQPLENDVACLFSGGVDSYAGILRAANSGKRVVGIFCAHTDQSKMIARVSGLGTRVRRNPNITLEKISVPGLGAAGYVQLRGFLYVVSAGAVIAKTRSSSLLVTECGPTMFQPRFSPLDSVTMTTHPMVMTLARRCLTLLLQRKVHLETPHQTLTKAEVMAICPDRDGLRHTHSCISQRFADHDGTCYGCVIRRLAAIAAGVPDVSYNRNPLWDGKASGGNLLELLRFSADILTRPNRLEEFQRRHISSFRVWDLFRRFATDNVAAAYSIHARRGRLRSEIKSLVDEVVNKIGAEALVSRLDQIRG